MSRTDFINYVVDTYKESISDALEEQPVRFQVTMQPDLGSEVIAFAEAADISRSGAICFLVDYAFDAIRRGYQTQKLIEAAKDPDNGLVWFTDETGKKLTAEEIDKAIAEESK